MSTDFSIFVLLPDNISTDFSTFCAVSGLSIFVLKQFNLQHLAKSQLLFFFVNKPIPAKTIADTDVMIAVKVAGSNIILIF